MGVRRREFLAALAAAAAGCAVNRARPSTSGEQALSRPAKKRILILGGTGFVGPPLVEAARARGHTVTLFNRGKTHPGLFPDVETIIGDRRTDLDKLKGREWDAVVDTWVMLPKSVRAAATLLRDHVGQYLFVSTISVYKLGREPIDESSPVLTPPVVDPDKIDSVEAYGGNKQLAEKAAELLMPGRATAIRAGVIVGPGDPSDRFIYWPLRMQRGGEVLVPGAPDDRMQHIDVRDLGAWIVRCIEERIVGVYNAVGPTNPALGAVLAACNEAAGGNAKLTWVDGKWLEDQQVGGWGDFPLVVDSHGDQAGFGHVSAQKAIARGLRFRPTVETARAALAWWQTQPEERRNKERPGLTAERETELLTAWHARG
jgi:2'-hydroxyisoflavone reductase